MNNRRAFFKSAAALAALPLLPVPNEEWIGIVILPKHRMNDMLWRRYSVDRTLEMWQRYALHELPPVGHMDWDNLPPMNPPPSQ